MVCQTTIELSDLREVIDRLVGRTRELVIHNTICDTTRDRQSEAEEISRRSTRMLVLGSKSSANTQKLLEICKKHCKNTENIDSCDKLFLDKLPSDDIIGIVAGASTPDRMIREVVQGMSELEKTTIETIEAAAPAEEIVGTPGTVDAESQPKETVTADSV